VLGDHSRTRAHAEVSQQHIPHGRPGWAAAVLVQARGEAARGRYFDATALVGQVLDTLPPSALRETSGYAYATSTVTFLARRCREGSPNTSAMR
jgi:hypothetical protein